MKIINKEQFKKHLNLIESEGVEANWGSDELHRTHYSFNKFAKSSYTNDVKELHESFIYVSKNNLTIKVNDKNFKISKTNFDVKNEYYRVEEI